MVKYDSKENNIVKDKDRFKKFKSLLDEEFKSLEKDRSFSNLSHMDKIIKELKCLKGFYLQWFTTTEMFRNDAKIIKGNVQSLYDLFFNSFQKNNHELLRFLNEKSMDYFFLRKISQLCHYHGVFTDELKPKSAIPPEFKTYFQLSLFLDFFETFPRFIQPILEPLWFSERGHFFDRDRNITRDRYRIFEKIIKDSFLARLYLTKSSVSEKEGEKKSKRLDCYFDLRNTLAHATVIFESDDLLLFDPGKSLSDEGQKTEKKSIGPILEKIEAFEKFVIVYATELDIRLLKLSLSKDDSIFPEWMEYFKIYNDAWQKIGSFAK